jgi:hypothetical protein
MICADPDATEKLRMPAFGQEQTLARSHSLDQQYREVLSTSLREPLWRSNLNSRINEPGDGHA